MGNPVFGGYFAYNFCSNFSAMFSVSENWNTYQLSETGNSNGFSGSGYTEKGVSNFWHCLAGPSFSFPIFNKFSIFGKVLAGYAFANYPSVTYTLNDPTPPLGITTTATYSFNNGTGLAYCIGTGLGYKVCSILSFHIDVNYIGSVIHFKDYNLSGNFDIYPGVIQSYYDTPSTLSSSMLQVVAGCSISL